MINHSAALDRVFHALADPSRRSMVDRLSRGPASVSLLAEPLEMSLPGVMQHLAVLEESGLVRTQKVGRVRTCTLDSDVLSAAESWLQERRSTWVRRLDRLSAALNAIDSDPEQKEES